MNNTIITIDADVKTIWTLKAEITDFAHSVTDQIQVFFRFLDPVYKRLYRKKSSRSNKMRSGSTMRNTSRIVVMEMVSSCRGFLYELYSRKVHPVSNNREFLGIPQNVQAAWQVS